jgi:tRNA(Ile)-lysidine synthase
MAAAIKSCLELIPDETRRIKLAFSGGLDSCVLLHLLNSSKSSLEIIPWHINHGLIDVATSMEQFCRDRALAYGLQIRIDHLNLDQVDTNIEAEARQQRYQLFEQGSGDGDCILTAHHANDQAETFLLNALRGSGVAGLRGIARQRKLGDALLLRPLLDFSREQLEAYANEHEISWFNDPSNSDTRFDRNYLRNKVIPKIKNRWPGFEQSLACASNLQSETQDLLDEMALIDFQQFETDPSQDIPTLQLEGLLSLTPGRCKNLIRFWIANAGFNVMSQGRMQELLSQLHSRIDAIPEISMPDYSIRLYDLKLFLVPVAKAKFQAGEFEFGCQQDIEIDEINLRLQRTEILDGLDIKDQDQSLMLKFREEGAVSDDRHRLKRLFQNHRIPPWQRNRVAQVYLNGKLEGILT